MGKMLITGGAGFIGSNLIENILQDNEWSITCVDNFDNYYSKKIKMHNIRKYIRNKLFNFIYADITDYNSLLKLTDNYDVIIHLAAKVGVRNSILYPQAYEFVNVCGTTNLLEFAKNKGIKKFVFASSSSVYGLNKKLPWNEDDTDLKPISPYAITKIKCEQLGKKYAELFGIRFTALRLFSVYGQRQRPDLVISKFSNAILKGLPLKIYGNLEIARDFTHINDIICGINSAINYNYQKFEVFNLGNGHAIKLKKVIEILENVFEKKAIIHYLPKQEGDVPITCSNIIKANRILNYSPRISIKQGLIDYGEWLNKNSLYLL